MIIIHNILYPYPRVIRIQLKMKIIPHIKQTNVNQQLFLSKRYTLPHRLIMRSVDLRVIFIFYLFFVFSFTNNRWTKTPLFIYLDTVGILYSRTIRLVCANVLPNRRSEIVLHTVCVPSDREYIRAISHRPLLHTTVFFFPTTAHSTRCTMYLYRVLLCLCIHSILYN